MLSDEVLAIDCIFDVLHDDVGAFLSIGINIAIVQGFWDLLGRDPSHGQYFSKHLVYRAFSTLPKCFDYDATSQPVAAQKRTAHPAGSENAFDWVFTVLMEGIGLWFEIERGGIMTQGFVKIELPQVDLKQIIRCQCPLFVTPCRRQCLIENLDGFRCVTTR